MGAGPENIKKRISISDAYFAINFKKTVILVLTHQKDAKLFYPCKKAKILQLVLNPNAAVFFYLKKASSHSTNH